MTAIAKPPEVLLASAEDYHGSDYLCPWRMASIGYQLKFVTEHFDGGSVLEVGAGSGVTSSLLRKLGYKVFSADLSPGVACEFRADVRSMALADGALDSFVCCQVLEHIPLSEVDDALAELRRVTRWGGVISVPTTRPTLLLMRYSAKRWGTRRMVTSATASQPMRAPHAHYWELESNYSTAAFEKKLKNAGFKIETQVQPVECMYHHFFVVRRA